MRIYLTEEAALYGIHSKTIGVISCGFVLCLGLFNAAQAVESTRTDPCAERKDGQPDPVKCDKERQQGITHHQG